MEGPESGLPVTSEVDRWVGRSGRVYVLEPGNFRRDGGMASIRRVVPTTPANTVSTVPEGTVLALKLARPDDRLALEAIGREVETFVALSRAPGSPPCPRLYDIVGAPVIGLVMEWCPEDMERWWEVSWSAPTAFSALCEALAELCRRVREFEAVAELELGKRVIHADIKPRNVLRAADGRWLLTDFGASKSRSVDEAGWAATRMILGTENFIAPEALFNARKPHPAAMDTWSLGCTFFALLRMRGMLMAGEKMPLNGTHAHPFRSQRVALVCDLQQRKPNLFIDKELDPSAFASPERLPDKDRRAVADALAGVFGRPSATLESVLVNETLTLLDRALRVDPAQRFRDPLEMASEFEALSQRYRELALRAEGGTGPARAAFAPSEVAPAGGASLATPGTGPRMAPAPASPGRARSEPPSTRPPSLGGASAPRVAVTEDIVLDDGSGRRGTGPGARLNTHLPRWVGASLVAVLGLQALQIVVTVAVLVAVLRAPDRPEVVLASAAAAPADPIVAAPASSLATVLAADPALVSGDPTVPSPRVADPVSRVRAAEADLPVPLEEGVVPKRLGTPAPLGSGSEGQGLLLVSGAQAYLVGPFGRMPVGGVAPGSYELFAQPRPDGEFESQGTIAVGAGERIVFKCGLGTCRRLP